MEPGLVFMGNGTMANNLTMSLMPARVGAWLAPAFGALGTLLAAIGLYGVIAFSVRDAPARLACAWRSEPGPAASSRMVLRQGFGAGGRGPGDRRRAGRAVWP